MAESSSDPAKRGLRIFPSSLAAVAMVLLWIGPVLAMTVPTDPEPDIECPADFGTGWLTSYTTTVNTPPDSDDWWVSVEFTIVGDATAECVLSLATYELEGATFTFPQTVYDWATGTFGPGTHTLTAALPLEGELSGCWSQYDFVFGPPVENLTFEDRYGDRQVRARIVGSDECGAPPPSASASVEASVSPEQSVSASASASASASEAASVSPEQSVEGATGTPSVSPEQSVQGATGVPDTGTPAGGGSIGGGAASVTLFGLLLITSLGSLAYLNVRSRRR